MIEFILGIWTPLRTTLIPASLSTVSENIQLMRSPPKPDSCFHF